MNKIIKEFLEEKFNASVFNVVMHVNGETRENILKQLGIEKYDSIIDDVTVKCSMYTTDVELTCLVHKITMEQFWELCSSIHFRGKPMRIYPSGDEYATFTITTTLNYDDDFELLLNTIRE